MDTRWTPQQEEEAGEAAIGSNTLRHSYVSWLVRSGVPLPVASELAGHTMVKTTMNYIGVFDTDDGRPWVG